MSHSRRSYTSRRRLQTTAKIAALIAALGFVTAMLEQPRLTASPSRASVTVEDSLETSVPGTAASAVSEAAATDETPLPASASERLPAYFPGQFSLPDRAIEPQPIGF
jgi:uncharacterized membrane protein